jgi:hypothetical protein
MLGFFGFTQTSSNVRASVFTDTQDGLLLSQAKRLFPRSLGQFIAFAVNHELNVPPKYRATVRQMMFFPVKENGKVLRFSHVIPHPSAVPASSVPILVPRTGS